MKRKASFCEQKETKNFFKLGRAGFNAIGPIRAKVFWAAFFQKSGCFPVSS
jgi:hypothetical protein